jgi:hypothetical protein
MKVNRATLLMLDLVIQKDVGEFLLQLSKSKA